MVGSRIRNVAVALILASGTANAAQLKGSESITIPVFGDSQNIIDVWQRPDGHLVFKFFYRKEGRAFTDFFDTRTGNRLFPYRAEELAHSPGTALQRELLPANLKKLEGSLLSISGPPGYSVSHDGYEGGSLCQVRYSSPIEIVIGAANYRFAVYRKLPSPRHFDSPCGGGGNVRINYTETSVRFISADKDGFWALLPYQSAIARFSWSGTSEFFDGRADPVVVPYEEITRARTHIEDRVPSQKEYEKAERVIQRYSLRQVQATHR